MVICTRPLTQAPSRINTEMNIFSNLRFRLLLLVMLAGAPVVCYTFWHVVAEKKEAIERAKSALQWAQSLAAANQDQKVEAARQVLRTLTQTQEIEKFGASACSAYLADLKNHFPEYLNIGIADLDGKIRCQALRPNHDINVSDRSYFRQALQQGQFMVGDYQTGRATGQEVIVFALPIRDDGGHISGIAFAAMAVNELFKPLSLAKVPAHARLTVMDRHATVLASTDPELRRGSQHPLALLHKKTRQASAGPGESWYAEDGMRVYALPQHTGAAQMGLLTVASMDKQAITQSAQQTLNDQLLFMGVILLLGAGLAVALADRAVTKPTKKILQSIMAFGAGHLGARAHLNSRCAATEVRGIAAGFNQMADATERRQQTQQRLHDAVRGIAGNGASRTDGNFLEQLTLHMTEALDADVGVIARPSNEDFLHCSTLAVIVNGRCMENFDFALASEHAESIRAQGCVIVADKFAELVSPYPQRFLADAQAYVRWRLDDSQGRPIGMVFVLYRRALQDTEFITSTLSIFAARAAAELEHQQDFAQIQRKAALLDLAQEAILVRDLEDRIQYWNGGATQMYGWTAEEVTGQAMAPPMYPDLQSFQAANAQVRAAGQWRGELQQQRKDGSRLWVDARWTLVRDAAGQPEGVFAINTDITERRALQLQLQQLNTELEERVQRRTTELAAANRELESFSYAVSHDLRAPLSTIAGFSQLLAKSDAERLGDKGRHYLDRIRASARHMSELIEGLLSLAQLSRQAVSWQEVDLSQLAEQVAQGCREREPARPVQLHIQPGLRVQGDARQLLAVMQNLLGNAWKFSARQAQPRIEIGSDTDADGQPRYYVRDNGAGFDMAQADRLFGAFQRLHSQADFSGTGIGLATVQRVIAQHGGRVWAQSQTGQGATFYFTLAPAAQILTPA